MTRILFTPWTTALIGLASLIPSIGLAQPEDRTKTIDCGVIALSVLHSLEGKSTGPGQILEKLPPRRLDGYSMAELSDASSNLGLPLVGTRVEGNGDPPSRPAIAFFRDSGPGHFAVVRPVGITGKMVQVIDPPFAPQILDFEQLRARTAWTGRVLIRQPHFFFRYPIRSSIVATLAVSSLLWVGVKLRRSPRPRLSIP